MGGREGWRDTPAGGRARVTGGGRVVVIGVGNGLSSPVYLMSLDRLKERS